MDRLINGLKDVIVKPERRLERQLAGQMLLDLRLRGRETRNDVKKGLLSPKNTYNWRRQAG